MFDYKIILPESEIPTHWYNIAADLDEPFAAVLAPNGKPANASDLSAIFPDPLIEQEMSSQRWIEIPEPVREAYKLWRPTPLYRAHRLEQRLGTPAKIYYKNEGSSPAGSHKPNSALPQAYYNKQAGRTRLTTETGAGQWGSSIAWAGQMFGLEVMIYMVKVSYDQKPFRRSMMNTWGAEVIASPSDRTDAGRAQLAIDPNTSGSLGMAISEAVEDAASRADSSYTLGSVLNHVLLHQTIIGQEAIRQFAMAGDYPDVIFAPCGGGSNFAGVAFPFLADKAAGKQVDLIAVEPSSCPTLTRGHFAYDFGDTAGLTPMMLMYTLGHDFVPPGIHAGGLRYHGTAPQLAQLVERDLIKAIAVDQIPTFEAGVLFAQTEGTIPAPESNHAIRAAIDEALRCKETGEEKTIFFNLSGHGHFDMFSYDRYFSGELEDYPLPQSAIDDALKNLPTR